MSSFFTCTTLRSRRSNADFTSVFSSVLDTVKTRGFPGTRAKSPKEAGTLSPRSISKGFAAPSATTDTETLGSARPKVLKSVTLSFTTSSVSRPTRASRIVPIAASSAAVSRGDTSAQFSPVFSAWIISPPAFLRLSEVTFVLSRPAKTFSRFGASDPEFAAGGSFFVSTK